tara:strand:+ start:6515 stop:6877 length:363 start_codon:yes stop_codon:yes gene_type:complete
MFFLAGLDKLLHFNKVVKGFIKRLFKLSPLFKQFPITLFHLAIIIVILIEIICPIIIVHYSYYKENYELTKLACYILLIFTILATLIYHFPPTGTTYYPFISNVTTCGAILLILYTLDYC